MDRRGQTSRRASHRHVEVQGEPYWDGGYSANPAVYPLFYDCSSADILPVLLHPLERAQTPHSIEQIESRIVDLAFSNTFLREMRMFVRAAQFARSSWLPAGRLSRRLGALRLSMIDVSAVDRLQRSDTKVLAHVPFLETLHAQGLASGESWLAQHASSIGKRASVDLQSLFS